MLKMNFLQQFADVKTEKVGADATSPALQGNFS